MTSTRSGRAGSGSGAPALDRMRSYTKWSLLIVLAVYVAGVAPAIGGGPITLVATLVVGALVCWQVVHWERGAPWPLVIVTLVVSGTFWWLAVAFDGSPLSAAGFAFSIGLVVSTPPFTRWPWTAASLALVMLPLVALPAAPGTSRADVPWVWLTGALIVWLASAVLFRVNRFAFGLYLEIDRAREAEADLAVLRERYRFASDLHDIQGQALHVGKLQLQLADKLLDDDPARAREHLRDAERLIGDAIAETRRLAYGTRVVTLAGELANSESLLVAAGIAVEITGAPPVGHRSDDLFGLLVREATTNLLRHSQAERVVITFAPGSVRIVNDGATSAPRELSGLGRLGDRFAAAGGALSTAHDGATFTTAAEVRA